MFYTNGYSRPIRYESYYPRAFKFDILSFMFQERSESQQIIELLTKYNKKYKDNGGLLAGIQFDGKTVGLRLLEDKKPGITFRAFKNQYYINYWVAGGMDIDVQNEANNRKDEIKEGDFNNFKKILQNILKGETVSNPEAVDFEAEQIISVLKRHRRDHVNLGGILKGIKFGKRNRVYKVPNPQNHEAFKNEYYINYWVPGGIMIETITSNEIEITKNYATLGDCIQALESIADIAT